MDFHLRVSILSECKENQQAINIPLTKPCGNGALASLELTDAHGFLVPDLTMA
jgi:hypothetical protein